MSHDFSHRTLSRKFVLHRRIGVGGMATVYEATNLQVGKRVAVKVLHPEFVSNEYLLLRFRQEARSVAPLSHPNIVQILDFDVDDGLPYIVMEYLAGCSLSQLIHRYPQPMAWRRVVRLCIQICAALQYAHDQGLVHRDVKPSNVFLLADPAAPAETVKLLDFGIAKLEHRNLDPSAQTRPSQVFGTPEYIAPEQAQGHPCDARIDLYALGVLMYRLLTGKLPFYAPTPLETLAQHVYVVPAAPGSVVPAAEIPPELDAIVLRALAKLPDQRWPSAAAMRAALVTLLAEPDTAAPAAPELRELPSSSRTAEPLTPSFLLVRTFEWRERLLRRRRLAAAFSGVAVGLAAFMFFSLFDLPGVAGVAGALVPTPPGVRLRPQLPDRPPPPSVAPEPPAPEPPAPEPPAPEPSADAPLDPALAVADTPPAQVARMPETTAPTSRPTRQTPPDPRRTLEDLLRRRKTAFRECSDKIPFGENLTLTLTLTFEPNTGRLLGAEADNTRSPAVTCALNVVRTLKYPRHVGPAKVAGIKLRL